MNRGKTSRAWEVANEVRELEEQCRATLEAALVASRALDTHLERIAKVEAPTKPPAASLTPEWRRTYRRLSRARDAAFQAFEECVARVDDTTA